MAKLKKHIITVDTYGNMDLNEYVNSLESFTILCKDTNNIYHKGSDINTVIVGDDLGITDTELKYVQNGTEYELFMNIVDGEFVIPETIQNKQNIESVCVPKHAYNPTTNMGTNVRIINTDAFNGCSALTHVSLSRFIKSIGNSSFKDCKNLMSIELPETIETIESCSFYNCKVLNDVILPNITRIESETFYGCESLAQLTIPNTVKSIGKNAFKGCEKLEQITFNGTHEQWKRIEKSDAGFDKLNLVVCTNGIYDYTTGKLSVDPNKVIYYTTNNGRAVTTYVDDWVSNTYEAGEGIIIFKNDITSIGFEKLKGTYSGYFSNNLVTITLPQCCTEIYSQTFYNCTNLTNINLENVTKIGYNTFYKCRKLEALTADAKNELTQLTETGQSVFVECDALKRVVIGDNLETLECYLFSKCNVLSEITIGNKVEQINTNAIYNCNTGQPVKLLYNGTSAEWTSINKADKYTWYTDTNISGVKCIKDGATIVFSKLEDCTIEYTAPNMITINIAGNKVDGEGAHVFDKGDGTIRMVSRVENLVPVIEEESGGGESCFSSDLTGITLPQSVSTIGYRAFAGTKIHNIDLTKTFTTEIGTWAFSSCIELETIKLPRTLQKIDSSTFDGCNNLKEVIFAGTKADCANIQFNDCFNFENTPLVEGIQCSNGTYVFGKDDDAGTQERPTTPTPPVDNPQPNTGDDELETVNYKLYYTSSTLSQISISPEYKTTTKRTVPWNIVKENNYDAEKNQGYITFKNSLTDFYGNIGESKSCFTGGDKLVTVSLPKCCTELHDYAFADCRGLNKINLKNVTLIGNYAFVNCESLTSIELSSDIISIGKEAFNGCKKLETITFNGTVNDWENIELGDYWYFGTQLENIKCVYGNITEYVELDDIKLDDEETINNPLGDWEMDEKFDEGRLIWVETTDGNQPRINTEDMVIKTDGITRRWNTVKQIKQIEEGVNLWGIEFTNPVTQIYGYNNTSCFGKTTKSLRLPDECTELRDGAFKDNTRLALIQLEHVEYIGQSVFEGCTSLKSIKLTTKLTGIGKNAFKNCKNLKTLIFDGTKEEWDNIYKGSGCFYGTQLMEVIGLSKEHIADIISDDNDVIVNTPTGDWELGDKEFYNGYALFYTSVNDKQIAFDTKVKKCIVDGIEKTDYEWNKVYMHKAYNKDGYYGYVSFENALTDIYGDISNSKNPISFAGDDAHNLECITLPDECIRIHQAAFYHCFNLKQINLENVKLIETNAFFDCVSLTKIILNKNVTIQEAAFNDCAKLTSIVYRGTESDWNNNCKENGSISPNLIDGINDGTRTITVTCAGGKKIYLGKQPVQTTETVTETPPQTETLTQTQTETLGSEE